MAPHRPEQAPAPLDPASPAMGELLRRSWRAGTLMLPSAPAPSPRTPSAPTASQSGSLQVALAGVGERFAAWRVIPPGGAALIVRIPHVAPDELHQDLAHEIAALSLLPAGVGPDPVAVHDDPATSPLGRPFVVTTAIPGEVAAPTAWSAAHLRAHAAHLARLHTVSAPGRGPVSTGPDPWSAITPGPQHLLPEVEGELRAAQAAHGAAIAEHRLAPLLEAALEVVAATEAQFAQLDGFVLCHGDLCATNILWDGADPAGGPPAVQYIDFEWAQGDDPARDLAILGGAVHGGPWYVPLTDEQVNAFVDAYVRARGELGAVPDSVADTASLRDRMRAWTAYERSAMLVHVASRAATSAVHRRVLPELRGTLAVTLGVDV